jgi:hypothetical protein
LIKVKPPGPRTAARRTLSFFIKFYKKSGLTLSSIRGEAGLHPGGGHRRDEVQPHRVAEDKVLAVRCDVLFLTKKAVRMGILAIQISVFPLFCGADGWTSANEVFFISITRFCKNRKYGYKREKFYSRLCVFKSFFFQIYRLFSKY